MFTKDRTTFGNFATRLDKPPLDDDKTDDFKNKSKQEEEDASSIISDASSSNDQVFQHCLKIIKSLISVQQISKRSLEEAQQTKREAWNNEACPGQICKSLSNVLINMLMFPALRPLSRLG